MPTRTRHSRKVKPTGFHTKAESDKRAASKAAIRAKQRRFKKAKPLPPEQELSEMIKAHMQVHGVVVCPPAYLAPTTALNKRKD